ncbi:MAG: vitamin B12 dependent-methionine synthase activation domain-containing protein [Candidatus Omnitrophota bacterium]
MKFSFPKLIKDKKKGQTPFGEKGSDPFRKVILAMGGGEVHDIGKTVIRALFKANGFEVIDLGAVDSGEELVRAAVEHKAGIVGVSCMLTSSLGELQQIARALQASGLDINFLVGGPGISPAMTAYGIAPHYPGGVTVYVRDLYVCHELCCTLSSPSSRQTLKESLKTEYAESSETFIRQQTAKTLLTIREAREQGLQIPWNEFRPAEPSFLGNRVFHEHDLKDLTELIDWMTMFLGFGLKGKYPQIFKDPDIGQEARQIFDDAQILLERIIKHKLLTARGVVGFYPANSSGDDIEIYSEQGSRQHVLEVLHTLRQQARHDDEKPYYALSDFIAPKESGKKDYIGAFALSCGFGLEKLEQEFIADNDDYHLIMVKVLADCLAEAFAERMHQSVRKEYWGYDRGETLTKEDMFRCLFQGIRPAPGYPACPEHSEKEMLFRLLDVKNNIAIDLSRGYAMSPAASVCGFYFSHPQSKYFWLGSVARDQVTDYARRKDVEVSLVEQQLLMHLNYIKE